MKVSSVAQMRKLDQTAINTYGIADELLMENAGLAVFEVIRKRIGIRGKRFLLFCGTGNNGGDGFVVARKIHAQGGRAKLFLLGDPKKYRGAAKLNWEIVNRLPVKIESLQSIMGLRSALIHCDAVIDAIFGTGLAREVSDQYAEVIDLINTVAKPVISVDIPSGVHGDTGQIMGTAIRADITVTFGLPKYGNLLYPGFERGGDLFVTHISFPPAMYGSEDFKVAVNSDIPLPSRSPFGHKGTFGDALFIAGGAQYLGAPFFAAHSFMKAGGGYSRLACPAGIVSAIATRGKEIVFMPQEETGKGNLALKNQSSLLEVAKKIDIVILGPGIGLEDDTCQLALELTEAIEKPLVIDGDGITAICENLSLLRKRTAPTVLTPHPGEMARIAGLKVADIEKESIKILQRTAKDLGAIIVLKGAHTLIGYPDKKVFINLSGNDGMASAGSGDVLTGTIAAMFGLGLPLEQAVRKGVFVHGLAGDLAAKDTGPDGVVALDILEYLPKAMKIDRKGYSSALSQRYFDLQVV